MDTDDEKTQMRYAEALAEWADAGGYDIEVVWDVCTTAGARACRSSGRSTASSTTLSGGEQKRLVLEFLLRGPDEVLLLDEPDNFLDVPGKTWLEQRINESPKTILYISHDRELLNNTATRVVTVELGAAGNTVWTHPGGFASYHEARRDRFARFEELRRRWDEEHAKLKALVLMYKQKAAYNDGMASQYQAAQTRLRKFEEAGPPQAQPREQQVKMRLQGRPHRQAGGGLRAARADRADEAVRPRGLVRRAGGRARLERVRQVALPAAAGRRRQRPRRRAPAGRRGAGRSRSSTPARPGSARGCGRAGSCRPTSTPSWSAARCWRSCTAATTHRDGMPREPAARALDRYELAHAAEQRFESLSGGQQARFQILLLELSGATLLLLDEPTDNLDVESAEALEDGLRGVRGHGAGGHPRPLVRPRLRPVPGLRRRRLGLRVRRPGVGRGTGAAGPLSGRVSGLSGSVQRPDGSSWAVRRCSGTRGVVVSSCTPSGSRRTDDCSSRRAARRRRRCRVALALRRDGQLGPGGERVRCHAGEESAAAR